MRLLMRDNGAALLAAVLVGLALGGCGSDEEPRPIPTADAAFLLTELDETERRVNARACSDAERGNITRIQKRVDRLPEDVDADVLDALNDSVASLGTLIEDQCRPKPRPKPVETTPLPDLTPEPEPTTPETTTPEPETTTEEKPPPDDGKGDKDGGDDGGGGDKGDGGGGGEDKGDGGGAVAPGAGPGGGAVAPGAVITPGSTGDGAGAEG